MSMNNAANANSNPVVFSTIPTSYEMDTAQFKLNIVGKSKSTTPLILAMNATYDAGYGILNVARKLPAIWVNATTIFNFI